LLDRYDITDRFDRAESTAKADADDPMEKAERNEPIDPIESIDPTDPTERIEPLDAMERTEPSDHNDQRDVDDDPCIIDLLRPPCWQIGRTSGHTDRDHEEHRRRQARGVRPHPEYRQAVGLCREFCPH
jgi:hypothetical protein